MRKSKTYRLTEHTINCLRELANRYECTETNVVEALIISRYQAETVPAPLSFGEVLDIIK